MLEGLDRGGLLGKVAVVTGASRQRGIGRACAVTLAGLGASVVVTGTDRRDTTFPAEEQSSGWRGAESVAAEVETLGHEAMALDVDVSDAAAVSRLVERTKARFSRVDVLVCAHAAPREESPVIELSEQEWDRILDINLKGTFLCCREVGRQMVGQGQGGRIVNISSVRGKIGRPRRSAYCASKAAIVTFTQCLAMEMAAHKITANVVCPGDVDTGRTAEGMLLRARKLGQTVEEVRAGAIAKIPLGRLAYPQEIANMVAFLASPAAAHITGQAFNVDGGEVMV